MENEFKPIEGADIGKPEIDLGIIGREREAVAKETEREMDILSDHPIAVVIGGKTYSLYPPTPGKIRLVLRMVKSLVGQFAKISEAEGVNSEELFDKVFAQGLDSFVDVARVLLEPNGKVIDLERLSVPREEIDFALTSKSFQNLLRQAFAMLDLPGLKKNLQASG